MDKHTAALTAALRAWDAATAHTRPGHTTVRITIGDTEICISAGQADQLAALLTREDTP